MSLQLNFLFSDGMVLQRDKKLSVWGEADPLAEVRVSLTDEAKSVLCEGSAAADQNGRWCAVLPPQPAMRSLTLRADCGDSGIEVQDVAIGEVWIASGQSNMEFFMHYDADYESEKKLCENADIRFFDTPRICCEEQLSEFDYREYGHWKPCDAAHLEYFSAVGYYFAKELAEKLSVPVGIVGCNRGGSLAAAWMDEESIAKHGQIWLDDYSVYTPELYERERDAYLGRPDANTAEPFADPIGNEMMYGMSREKQLELMQAMPAFGGGELPQFYNYPGCLYENMLKKIIPYTARGVIWYQGESDCEHPQVYGDLFLDMAELWRSEFGDQLPFLTVQLAPFSEWMACEGCDYPIVRAQQQKAADQGEQVYVVSSSDVGMRYDIHPKKKAPIGHRLALCACAEIYGQENAWRAPIGAEAVYENGELRIAFSDGEGLHIQGDTLHAFALIRKDETLFDGDRGIGQELGLAFAASDNVVTVQGLSLHPGEDCEVRFAWADYYEVNLYNQAGVPAMPFVLPVHFAVD